MLMILSVTSLKTAKTLIYSLDRRSDVIKINYKIGCAEALPPRSKSWKGMPFSKQYFSLTLALQFRSAFWKRNWVITSYCSCSILTLCVSWYAKGLGISLCQSHKLFQRVAFNIVLKQYHYLVFKSLKTLASLWIKVVLCIHFQNREILSILKICSGK